MKQVNKILEDELKNTNNRYNEALAKREKLMQELTYLETEVNHLFERAKQLSSAILALETVKEVPVVKTTSKNKKTKS